MILKDAEGNYEIILEDEKAAVQHGSEETHYTVIESSGEVENRGYCVLNNIYVNEGMESPFEARFLNRQSNLSSVDGFKAIRVMKAASGPYYVILTYGRMKRHSMAGKSQNNMGTHTGRGAHSPASTAKWSTANSHSMSVSIWKTNRENEAVVQPITASSY